MSDRSLTLVDQATSRVDGAATLDDGSVASTGVFERFRARARALLADRVTPEQAMGAWAGVADGAAAPSLSASGDLFGAGPSAPSPRADQSGLPPLRVPRATLALARRVVLHREPGRFDALYHWLWRLSESPCLRHDLLDPEWLRLRQMARAVQRDAYKLRAFVRFRPLQDAEHESAEPLHVAWFEPEHDVLEAVAPWFARRFAGMRWCILTPRRSVRWDPASQRLEVGPGARRADAPAADAGEALWLTYYRHTFNPARLNLPLMRQHMPRKYWHNLPEASEIAALAAAAPARTAAMTRAADDPHLLSKQELPAQAWRRPVHVLTSNGGSGPSLELASADAVAAACGSLSELRAATQRCRACPIGACATQAVNGVGALGARLMLVGEQPGDQEDLAGEPFVGPAGQLLDRALAQLALPRATRYLTNAVRHFKHELRGKRRLHKTPAQREAQACNPWLLREVELVRPHALVALGATAARALLGPSITLSGARGQWLAGPGGLPVRVTWHPAALLRLPPAERDRVWPQWLADLRAAAHGAPAAPAHARLPASPALADSPVFFLRGNGRSHPVSGAERSLD